MHRQIKIHGSVCGVTDKLEEKTVQYSLQNCSCKYTWYGGGNSTTAEEVSRFQRLFPNPSWLV